MRYLIALAALCASAFAAKTTITGTVVGPGGTPVRCGITATPRSRWVNSSDGTSLLDGTATTVRSDSLGAFSISLYANDQTVPAGTSYRVTFDCGATEQTWVVPTSLTSVSVTSVITPSAPFAYYPPISATSPITFNTQTGVIACPTCSGVGPSGGIGSLNGLLDSAQTFSSNNDTNVTLGISSASANHAFTLGWSGTLSKVRQNAATLYNDQSNTIQSGGSLSYTGTGYINANRIMGTDISALSGVVKFTLGVPSVVTGNATDCVLVNGTSGTCGSGVAGITALNGLSGATQTFGTTNDTNVTVAVTSAGTNHQITAGWTGTLAKARQNGATLYNDQSNTMQAGSALTYTSTGYIDANRLLHTDVSSFNGILKMNGAGIAPSVVTGTATDCIRVNGTTGACGGGGGSLSINNNGVATSTGITTLNYKPGTGITWNVPVAAGTTQDLTASIDSTVATKLDIINQQPTTCASAAGSGLHLTCNLNAYGMTGYTIGQRFTVVSDTDCAANADVDMMSPGSPKAFRKLVSGVLTAFASGDCKATIPFEVMYDGTYFVTYNLPNGTGGGGTWGSITGTLSAQTDLQTALNAKESTANKNAASGYAGLDGSSKLSASQLPNPSASTLGGVQSYAAVSNQYITSISTSGVPASSRPSCATLSDGTASCSTDTTNASNISTGTLSSSRLPAAALVCKTSISVPYSSLTTGTTQAITIAAGLPGSTVVFYVAIRPTTLWTGGGGRTSLTVALGSSVNDGTGDAFMSAQNLWNVATGSSVRFQYSPMWTPSTSSYDLVANFTSNVAFSTALTQGALEVSYCYATLP